MCMVAREMYYHHRYVSSIFLIIDTGYCVSSVVSFIFSILEPQCSTTSIFDYGIIIIIDTFQLYFWS